MFHRSTTESKSSSPRMENLAGGIVRAAASTNRADIRNALKIKAAVVTVVVVVTLVVAYSDIDDRFVIGSLSQKKRDVAYLRPDYSFDLNSTSVKYDKRPVPVYSSPISEPRGQGKHKILWSTAFPDAVDLEVMRRIVNGVTGLPYALQKFHARSKTLSRCRADRSVTALCLSHHPIVDSDPERSIFHRHFGESSLQILRNPKTAFPAYLNGKNVRFEGGSGQMSIEVWRKKRNASIREMMALWVKSIHAWKSMSRYHVDLYFPIEYLYDPLTGPDLVRRLADFFEHSGYPTLLQHLASSGDSRNDDPWGTFWYHSLGGLPALEQFQKYRYEYSDYTPGYTLRQKNLMISELEKLIRAYRQTDAQLTDILEFYRDDIKNNTVLD